MRRKFNPDVLPALSNQKALMKQIVAIDLIMPLATNKEAWKFDILYWKLLGLINDRYTIKAIKENTKFPLV